MTRLCLCVDGPGQRGNRIKIKGDPFGYDELLPLDVISIEGVDAVDSLGLNPSGVPLLMEVADVSDGLLTLRDNLIFHGPYRNASAEPIDGAAIFNHSNLAGRRVRKCLDRIERAYAACQEAQAREFPDYMIGRVIRNGASAEYNRAILALGRRWREIAEAIE